MRKILQPHTIKMSRANNDNNNNNNNNNRPSKLQHC